MSDTAAKTTEPGSLEALLAAVMEQHPRPWIRCDGCGDRGERYISIEDAEGECVLDGEYIGLSEPVFAFLMKLGELKNA